VIVDGVDQVHGVVPVHERGHDHEDGHDHGHDHGRDQKWCPLRRFAARYAINAQAMWTSAM
jgi:hypothetical protein